MYIYEGGRRRSLLPNCLRSLPYIDPAINQFDSRVPTSTWILSRVSILLIRVECVYLRHWTLKYIIDFVLILTMHRLYMVPVIAVQARRKKQIRNFLVFLQKKWESIPHNAHPLLNSIHPCMVYIPSFLVIIQ